MARWVACGVVLIVAAAGWGEAPDLHGTIEAVTGGPAVGVKVTACLVAPGQRAVVQHTVTDALGEWHVNGLGESPLPAIDASYSSRFVVYNAPGAALALATPRGAEVPPTKLCVLPDLELQVRQRSGEPVGGATVVALMFQSRLLPKALLNAPPRGLVLPDLMAVTGPDGVAHFRGLAANGQPVREGQLYVAACATVGGRFQAGSGEVKCELPPADPEAGRVVSLDPGQTVSGTVTSAVDGKPIADAQVWLESSPHDAVAFCPVLRTARDGSFTFATVGSTLRLVALATHPDHRSTLAHVMADRERLGDAPAASTVNLAMGAVASVTGRLLDATSGRPLQVPGQLVVQAGEQYRDGGLMAGPPTIIVKVPAGGSFSAKLPLGLPYTKWMAVGYQPPPTELVPAGGLDDVVVRMVRRTDGSLVILGNPDGTPAKGVVVWTRLEGQTEGKASVISGNILYLIPTNLGRDSEFRIAVGGRVVREWYKPDLATTPWPDQIIVR